MREITRELELAIPVESTFALLHTPSAVRGWWSAARAIIAPREGGLWVATWGADEDAPEYITAARILAWHPPHRLLLGAFEYFMAAGGLPFDADFETEFTVAPSPRGSILRVHQTGFPDEAVADEFYAGCERGWEATLEGVRRYVAERSGSRATIDFRAAAGRLTDRR
ncbi:MAG TPA: SRPBCC domain-containing protein [Gemmatimonadaceae bacterium]|nr:SRPBCC domain-containing protein [Gemmatimonadaceae bacterium]